MMHSAYCACMPSTSCLSAWLCSAGYTFAFRLSTHPDCLRSMISLISLALLVTVTGV
jgi:hypothetical protein